MIVALAPVARVGEVRNVFFQMLAPLADVLLVLPLILIIAIACLLFYGYQF